MKRFYVLSAAALFLLSANLVLASDTIFTDYSDLNYPAGQTKTNFADFNGDGNMDMLIANAVFLNKGDGTFNEGITHNGPVSVGGDVATGDFNNDGKTDFAVIRLVSADGAVVDSYIVVLLGNGDGTFAPNVEYPANLYPFNLRSGDLNNDGKLDLIVQNGFVAETEAYPQYFSVLMGNLDGTFAPAIKVEVGSTFLAFQNFELGDMNGDGKLDIVYTVVPRGNTLRKYFKVIYGNGDGTFQVPTIKTYAMTSQPTLFDLGDLNADGKLDVVLLTFTNLGYPTYTPIKPISVFINTGAGFSPEAKYELGSSPIYGTLQMSNITLGDFTGDGKVDLAGTDYTGGKISVFAGNGDGTLNPSFYDIYFQSQHPNFIGSADLNNDNKLDIAFSGTVPAECLPEMISCPPDISVVSVLLSDIVPPGTSITSIVDGNGKAITDGGISYSTDMSIGFTGTDIVTPTISLAYSCSLDGSAFEPCNNPVNYTGLSIGNHAFLVQAIDLIGNIDQSPASLSWTITDAIPTMTGSIQKLVTMVFGLNLQGVVTNKLVQPLEHALKKLTGKGEINGVMNACNDLDLFLTRVNGEIKSKTNPMSLTVSSALISDANQIQDEFGCNKNKNTAGIVNYIANVLNSGFDFISSLFF